MARRVIVPALLTLFVIVLLLAVSLMIQLSLPEPTGPYAVGRTSLVWEDNSRQEVMTRSTTDHRQVAVQFWYPAQDPVGMQSPYFPGLRQVSAALRESGEVSAVEVAGLALIRSNSFWQAAPVEEGSPFPVLLLSPGNGTNVEFYSGLAEELASLGFVVVGVNHSYDVAAVAVHGDRVIGYDREQWDLTPQEHQQYTQARMGVRVEDLLFVLERLAALNQADELFAGRLDLERVGVIGHSLGGIAAAMVCQRDPRVDACLNLDGIQAGGPFSVNPDPPLLDRPFLFLTKEEQLHPVWINMFESLPRNGYVVVIHGANHDHFTDGPLLTPSILPVENRADRVLEETRRFAAAFFLQELEGEAADLLAEPKQDGTVEVRIYP